MRMKWTGFSLLRGVLRSRFRSGRRIPIRRNIVLYEEDIRRLEPFIEEQRQFMRASGEEFKPNFSAIIRRVIKLAYEHKMKEDKMEREEPYLK